MVMRYFERDILSGGCRFKSVFNCEARCMRLAARSIEGGGKGKVGRRTRILSHHRRGVNVLRQYRDYLLKEQRVRE